MLDLLIAFLCGAALTVILILVGLLVFFNSLPVTNHKTITKGFEPFVRPQLPPYLEELYSNRDSSEAAEVNVEPCRWVNLVSNFLFRELRDSTFVKRILMKKINNEFEELLMTRTEGKMLEQLTVRDYFLGTSMPIIKDVTVVRIECSPDDDKDTQMIELAMHIDYNGGVETKIDADLVFGKSAYVAVKVLSLKGRMRVIFSRLPSTHWSFSFYQEPEIKMQVDSHFEGRSFPKLSSIIESQIRRFIRKKYVIPSAKMRHKPFFKKAKPQDQLLEVYVKDAKLTVGELQVEVVDCSRLVQVESATRTYCTLALDHSPYRPRVNLWRTHWPTHELVVTKDLEQRIGIHYKLKVTSGVDRSQVIVVDKVFAHSAAKNAGILVGDVLIRINNVRVTSVKQVEKQIQRTKGNSVLVTLQRPPPHLNPFASSNLPPRSSNRSGDTTLHAEQSADSDALERAEGSSDNEGASLRPRSRTMDADAVSLYGVSGERRLDQGEGLRHRASTSSVQATRRSPTPETEVGEGFTAVESPPLTLADTATASVEPSPLRPMAGRQTDSPVSNERPTEGNTQQTSKVPARKNPSWSESFVFNITEEHNYLNVCVWSKLKELNDLFIGHVTIPLMDIALECLCTSSGYHHQRFVLVAAQTLKPSASRATLQVKSSKGSVSGNPSKEASGKKKWESVYAGDIFLRFKHCPDPNARTTKDVTQDLMDNEDISTEDPQPFPRRPFTAEEGYLPEDHNFIETQSTDGRQECEICKKKIWALKSKPMKCRNCGLKCHKKCTEYCKKNVPCTRTSAYKLSLDNEFTLLEVKEEEGPPKRGDSGGHRKLQQESESNSHNKVSSSSSFEMLDEFLNTEKVQTNCAFKKARNDSSFVILEASATEEHLKTSTTESDAEKTTTNSTRDSKEASVVIPGENDTDGVREDTIQTKDSELSTLTRPGGKDGADSRSTADSNRGEQLETVLSKKTVLPLEKIDVLRTESSDESVQLYTPPIEESDNSSAEEDYIAQYRRSSRMQARLELLEQARVLDEIAEKQVEIDHYTELANITATALKDPNISCSDQEQLRINLADYEEKIESLSLSMKTKMQVANIPFNST